LPVWERRELKMETYSEVTGSVRRKEEIYGGLFKLLLTENENNSFEIVELICNPQNAYSVDSVYKWKALNLEEANKIFDKKLNELKELL
jgi:hypothetical protein